MYWDSIIFDFDGVLVDSVDIKARAFRKMFEQYGDDVAERVVMHHNENGGMSRYDKFKIYYEIFLGIKVSSHKVENLSNVFSTIVLEEVIKSPEIAGATSFLEKYSNRLKFFVNSGTPTDELREIVVKRNWSKYFEDVMGSPNNKKQNIELILRKYNLNLKKCFFIGDALSDYEAAFEYDIKFFAIAKDTSSVLLNRYPHVKWFKDYYELENSILLPCMSGLDTRL